MKMYSKINSCYFTQVDPVTDKAHEMGFYSTRTNYFGFWWYISSKTDWRVKKMIV